MPTPQPLTPFYPVNPVNPVILSRLLSIPPVFARSGVKHIAVHDDHADQEDQSEEEVVCHGSSFWVNEHYSVLRGREGKVSPVFCSCASPAR